jgi:hypothetical protein
MTTSIITLTSEIASLRNGVAILDTAYVIAVNYQISAIMREDAEQRRIEALNDISDEQNRMEINAQRASDEYERLSYQGVAEDALDDNWDDGQYYDCDCPECVACEGWSRRGPQQPCSRIF